VRQKLRNPTALFSLFLLPLILIAQQPVPVSTAVQRDWPAYGGGPEDTRYSPLSQINRDNVRDLQLAWTYDTGEPGGLQTSPIIVNGVLYGITPNNGVFALNAATGKEIWKFHSQINAQPNRGLSYWSSGNDKRILVGISHYEYALNAETGEPIATFGEQGRIDLRKDLGRDFERQSLTATSPGIIYKNLIILGMREPETLPAPPGDIRAYDIRTGKLRWSFHTIPHPGEEGYDTWPKDAWTYSGGANNWCGMALDEKRGMVYVPTGSAASDFYGSDRIGDNLFANSLIALNAETGQRIWHFQSVKHDLWDRDFPSPPVLLTVKRAGKMIDAVAETTKSGYVFVFDRSNGEPLFPIEYRPYPKSTVPGERAAETQPLPSKPAPFARQRLTEDLLTTRTPEAHQAALEQFHKFRNLGEFVPFAVGAQTVVFPGFDGGAEWGGPAVDPDTGVLYVNANDVVFSGALAKNNPRESNGRKIYLNQCAVCHGDQETGSPPEFPSLEALVQRRSPAYVENMIRHGKGRMPAFSGLSDSEIAALIEHFYGGETGGQISSSQPVPEYHFSGYVKFVDPDGYPAVAPPWGTLSAIDLNSGEYLWQIPLGEYPELAAKGMKNTGTENYGGPIVTAGGLVFIGATNFDKKLHAFDKQTGKLLWETVLPFAGNATPATYLVNRRQFVAIAASGGKALNLPSRGVYVAYALPK
jgi:quinoprotein glucose dehydrogenase